MFTQMEEFAFQGFTDLFQRKYVRWVWVWQWDLAGFKELSGNGGSADDDWPWRANVGAGLIGVLGYLLPPSYFFCPLFYFEMSQNIVLFLKIKVINLLMFLLYPY